MKLEIPVKADFDDIQDMIDEIKRLQTYKLFEGDDMVLVDIDAVVAIMVNHIRATDNSSESPSGWIPCSERLPEEDNVEVLCTVKQQSKTNRSETIIVEQGCYFYGTWLLSYDNQRVNCSREVLAWQPLPSPYQEEGEEE